MGALNHNGRAALIDNVRDEMNRLRGHLFEAAEATGMPTGQEDAFKGLIRTFTYDAQTAIEAKLRRGA